MFSTILLIIWMIFIVIKYIFDSFQDKKVPKALLVSPLFLIIFLYIGFTCYYLFYIKNPISKVPLNALLASLPALIALLSYFIAILIIKISIKKGHLK